MIALGDTLLGFIARVYVPAHLGIKPESVRQYEIAVRLWERFEGRSLSVYDFDEVRLRSFLSAYLASGVSPATVNAKRRLLLALWNWAWEEELVDRPPRLRRIPRAREPIRAPEAWTPSQVGQLLAATCDIYRGNPRRGAWWRAGLLFLYDTGCRIGEALAMEAGDLDLDHGTATFRDTKTGAVRIAQLHPDTVAKCAELMDPDGKPWPWCYSSKWLTVSMQRLCERAGVPHGRARGGLFHKLRRTSGSLVEMHGGDGAKHIGDSRRVFEKHYLDPRMVGDTLRYLPRPEMPGS